MIGERKKCKNSSCFSDSIALLARRTWVLQARRPYRIPFHTVTARGAVAIDSDPPTSTSNVVQFSIFLQSFLRAPLLDPNRDVIGRRSSCSSIRGDEGSRGITEGYECLFLYSIAYFCILYHIRDDISDMIFLLILINMFQQFDATHIGEIVTKKHILCRPSLLLSCKVSLCLGNISLSFIEKRSSI